MKIFNKSPIFMTLAGLIVLSSINVNAQVSVTLHQPPPNQLNVEHLWAIDLTNPTDITYTVYLQGTATEERKGVIFDAKSARFDLPPGFKRVNVPEISPIDVDYFNKKYEDVMLRTGSVPEGDYSVCIYVINVEDGEELARHCIPQQVAHPSPPQLISPKDGATVEDKFPVFTWMPPMPLLPGQGVSYHLKIVEILGDQTPIDAMQSNPTWFEEDGIATTSFRRPVGARAFEPGVIYCWWVQALDSEGWPVGENEGRSEIQTFGFQAIADLTAGELMAPILVDCRIQGMSFLLSPTICSELEGTPGPAVEFALDDYLPHDDIFSVPFFVFWEDPPYRVPTQKSVEIRVQSDIDEDQPVGIIFSYCAVLDTVWRRIGIENDGSDGWGTTWNVTDLPSGFYEIRARAVNRNNEIVESHFFTQLGTLEPPLSEERAVSEIAFTVTEGDIRRAAGQAQAARSQIEQEEARIKALRQEMEEALREWRQKWELARELERIDKILDPIPNAFRDSVNTLLDSLRRIRAQAGGVPDTAALNRAVRDAQRRLDECQQRLNNLRREKQNLEAERDNLKAKQDDLLNQMDQLHRDNGWPVGGHGYHSNGRRWWGYVGDENSNTNLEPQYSNLKNQIDRLNRRYMAALARLNQISGPPSQIDQAQQECDRLANGLQVAQNAKARGDQYEACKTNINDLCRQIQSLLQKLLDWCNNNPGQCNFQAQLKALVDDCPDDSTGWEQFWSRFGQVVNAKKDREAQIRREADQARRRAAEISKRIREAEDRIRDLEREERRRTQEAERLRRRRKKEQEEAAQRAREARTRELEKIKPKPYLDEEVTPSDDQLKFQAQVLFRRLWTEYIASRGPCHCITMAIAAANNTNTIVEDIIGRIGVGVAFAPLEAFPGLSLGTRLGIGIAKALCNYLYGGASLPKDLAKNLFEAIGGELFPKLVGNQFAGDALNRLASGGLETIMKEEGIRVVQWEGTTNLRNCGRVSVKTTLLINPKTGWVVITIKIPNCPLVVIKYRVNDDGVPQGNPIVQEIRG